jgi:hypothetical protein
MAYKATTSVLIGYYGMHRKLAQIWNPKLHNELASLAINFTNVASFREECIMIYTANSKTVVPWKR